jgi:hypothetical protein
MGGAERRRARVQSLVEVSLDPRESVVAILPRGWVGPAVGGPVGLMFIQSVAQRCRAVVVTDRRVLLVRCTYLRQRPRALLTASPRDSVHVSQWQRASFGASPLVLDTGDAELQSLTVRVPLADRDAADAVVTALGGSPPTST